MKNIPSHIPSDDPDDPELRAYFEAETQRAKDNFILTLPQLDALLDYLDAELQQRGCDGTLQRTILWAVENRVDPEALCEQLEWLGGCCDDEVVYNVDPAKVFA